MENFEHQLDNKKYVDNDNSNTNYVSTVERINELERNELIEELKSETVPPIEGVKDMKKMSESVVMIEVLKFLNEKTEENIKKWNWNEVLCSWVEQKEINPKKIERDEIKLENIKNNLTWKEVYESNPAILNYKELESFKTDEEFIKEVRWYCERLWAEGAILNYKHTNKISRNTIKKSISGQDEASQREQIYRLFSEKDNLYMEFLSNIWSEAGLILWVEDRWNRWWFDTWGMHMWVDYNLPKWTPVNSIYEWKVVVIWTQEWIKKDPNVKRSDEIEQFFKSNEQDKDIWSLWSMMIIQHKIWWKTFYSYYLHITCNKEPWTEIEKGEEIWKLAGYDTNKYRQPHLHFTITENMTLPIIRGYLNKNTITESEKNEYNVVDIEKELKKNPKLSDQGKKNFQEKNKEAYQKLYNEKYGKDMVDPSEVYN